MSTKCPRNAPKLSGGVENTIFGKVLQLQGGSGTEPEPETGTIGTVFPKTESGTGTARTIFQEPNLNRNRPFLLNCTEIHKNPFCRGTAGTENPELLEPFHVQTVTELNRTGASLYLVDAFVW